MATQIRWAVVGVGRAGVARGRAIQADPQGTLVCAWRGRNLHQLDCPAASDLDDALGQVDAVAICSPDHAHAGQIQAALKANKHVVVEFPICHCPLKAAELFDLARKTNRTLHVAHIELLHGPQRLLRDALPQPPASASLTFTRPGPLGSASALALGNVARLHRLVDLFGPVTHVHDLAFTPGALSGSLSTASTRVAFQFEQTPDAKRATLLKLSNSAGNWTLTGRELRLNGKTRDRPEAEGLFLQDQRHASSRILRDCSSYVVESQILHILDIAEQLSNLGEGPLRPAL